MTTTPGIGTQLRAKDHTSYPGLLIDPMQSTWKACTATLGC